MPVNGALNLLVGRVVGGYSQESEFRHFFRLYQLRLSESPVIAGEFAEFDRGGIIEYLYLLGHCENGRCEVFYLHLRQFP